MLELTRKDLLNLGLSEYHLKHVLKDIPRIKRSKSYIYQINDIKYSILNYLEKKGIKLKTKELLLDIYNQLSAKQTNESMRVSQDLESEIRESSKKVLELEKILNVINEVKIKRKSKRKSVEQLKLEFDSEVTSFLRELGV